VPKRCPAEFHREVPWDGDGSGQGDQPGQRHLSRFGVRRRPQRSIAASREPFASPVRGFESDEAHKLVASTKVVYESDLISSTGVS